MSNTTACREDGTVAPGAPLAGSKRRHRGARAVPSPPPLPAPPAPGTPRRCRGMFLSCSTQQRRTRPRFRGLTVRAAPAGRFFPRADAVSCRPHSHVWQWPGAPSCPARPLGPAGCGVLPRRAPGLPSGERGHAPASRCFQASACLLFTVSRLPK